MGGPVAVLRPAGRSELLYGRSYDFRRFRTVAMITTDEGMPEFCLIFKRSKLFSFDLFLACDVYDAVNISVTLYLLPVLQQLEIAR